MKNSHPLKIPATALLCLSAAVLTVGQALCARPMAKLERCHKSIRKDPHKAMECFSEVMIDGSQREKGVASYFLGLMVQAEPSNIPSISEASERILALAKAPPDRPVAASTAAAGAAPAPSAEKASSAVYYRPIAQKPDTRLMEPALARSASPARRRGRFRPNSFRVTEISGNSAAGAEAERYPKAEDSQAVGSFEAAETPAAFAKEPVKPASAVDVSSVTLQEMDLAPDVKVVESVENTIPNEPPPVASGSLMQPETSRVALASGSGAEKFTIEDDLAAEGDTPQEQTSEVRFAANSVEIGSSQLDALKQAAGLLGSNSGKITVRGLAAPAEKNPENLSEMRARIVKHLLERKFRIPSGRVSVDWGIGVNQEDQRVIIAVKAAR